MVYARRQPAFHCHRSVGVAREELAERGADQDLQIQQQRPVLDVPAAGPSGGGRRRAPGRGGPAPRSATRWWCSRGSCKALGRESPDGRNGPPPPVSSGYENQPFVSCACPRRSRTRSGRLRRGERLGAWRRLQSECAAAAPGEKRRDADQQRPVGRPGGLVDPLRSWRRRCARRAWTGPLGTVRQLELFG